jgi:hypothetical protein
MRGDREMVERRQRTKPSDTPQTRGLGREKGKGGYTRESSVEAGRVVYLKIVKLA